MTLTEYAALIEQMDGDQTATPGEKHEALTLIAHCIACVLWEPLAHAEAQALSSLALAMAEQYPEGGRAARDSLAAKGWLTTSTIAFPLAR